MASWARVRLAWRVFRNPSCLIPVAEIEAVEPATGPLHSVVRVQNRVEIPVYTGRDGQQAARLFRARRDANTDTLIYRVNGSIRDQYSPR